MNITNTSIKEEKIELATQVAGLYIRNFIMTGEISPDPELRFQIEEILIGEAAAKESEVMTEEQTTINSLKKENVQTIRDYVVAIETAMVEETTNAIERANGHTDLNSIDAHAAAQVILDGTSIGKAAKNRDFSKSLSGQDAMTHLSNCVDFCEAVAKGHNKTAEALRSKAPKTQEAGKSSGRG